MKAYSVNLWVYAETEQDAKALQTELDKFVIDKYNSGILVKANNLRGILQKYGNSAIVNAVLKQ